MVGVAGRSKACNTCRQRRIKVRFSAVFAPTWNGPTDCCLTIKKCSYERPHCAQCIKSNFRCTGYQRERQFVVGSKFVQGQPTLEEQRSSMHMVRSTPSKVIWQAAPSPHASYRLQLLNEFLGLYLPVTHLGPVEDRPWLSLVTSLPSPTRALEVAVMALSTARLGRVKNDPSMMTESLQLYTLGLSEIQKALWNPALMYKDETLAASMALAMYELSECPSESKSGYISHHKGCARLVQLRGVNAHISGLGHQVFLTFRMQGVSCLVSWPHQTLIVQILEALQPHHATYLSEEPWIDGPWKDRQKRPMDALLDHLARAPGIFNQVHELQERAPHEVLPTALFIIKQCWEVDRNMRTFYENLERSIPGPLYWPEFSTTRGTAGERALFPISFHFPDLNIANMLMIYWATATMLWSGMSQLYRLVRALSSTETTPNGEIDGSSQSDTSQLPPLEHRLDYHAPARNVCQSVEYCVQDQMLGFGMSSVVAPLTILAETLRHDSKFGLEILWISHVLKKVDEQGVRILRHI